MIIGLKDETDRRFLVCTPKHCTSLGYGFHHIGMLAEAVLTIDREDFNAMLEAMLKFEVTAEKRRALPPESGWLTVTPREKSGGAWQLLFRGRFLRRLFDHFQPRDLDRRDLNGVYFWRCPV